MPKPDTRTEPRSFTLTQLRPRATVELDIETARLSSTPEALTVIDPRASTLGLRAIADRLMAL